MGNSRLLSWQRPLLSLSRSRCLFVSELANISPTLPLDGMNPVLESTANLGAPPSGRLALKHELDLLKGLARCFGVEEKDMYGNDGAERAEYHVRLPCYVRERRGHEQRKGQVEDPVSSSGDPDTLGSVGYGENLGGVDPSHGSLLVLQSAKEYIYRPMQNITGVMKKNSPRSLRRLLRRYNNRQ